MSSRPQWPRTCRFFYRNVDFWSILKGLESWHGLPSEKAAPEVTAFAKVTQDRVGVGGADFSLGKKWAPDERFLRQRQGTPGTNLETKRHRGRAHHSGNSWIKSPGRDERMSVKHLPRRRGKRLPEAPLGSLRTRAIVSTLIIVCYSQSFENRNLYSSTASNVLIGTFHIAIRVKVIETCSWGHLKQNYAEEMDFKTRVH